MTTSARTTTTKTNYNNRQQQQQQPLHTNNNHNYIPSITNSNNNNETLVDDRATDLNINKSNTTNQQQQQHTHQLTQQHTHHNHQLPHHPHQLPHHNQQLTPHPHQHPQHTYQHNLSLNEQHIEDMASYRKVGSTIRDKRLGYAPRNLSFRKANITKSYDDLLLYGSGVLEERPNILGPAEGPNQSHYYSTERIADNGEGVAKAEDVDDEPPQPTIEEVDYILTSRFRHSTPVSQRRRNRRRLHSPTRQRLGSTASSHYQSLNSTMLNTSLVGGAANATAATAEAEGRATSANNNNLVTVIFNVLDFLF